MVLALAARRRLRMQIISCGYRGYNVGVTDFSLDYRLAVVLVSSVQGVEWKKGFRPYLQQVARLGGRRALCPDTQINSTRGGEKEGKIVFSSYPSFVFGPN